MKAEFLNREINTVSMTMDVTAEEFEECINNVYNKTKSRFNVPGFRRGKAPRTDGRRISGDSKTDAGMGGMG